MTQREQDKITSLAWLATGLAICVGAARLSLGSFREPGPGLFAFLSGAILALLSSVVLLRIWRVQSEKERCTQSAPFFQSKDRVVKMLYVMIALVLYTVGMDHIGFSLSTLLFVGFVLRIVDPQPWRTVLICSILASSGSWFVFKYWLDVELPGGIIGY